jgi:hypothetical protein
MANEADERYADERAAEHRLWRWVLAVAIFVVLLWFVYPHIVKYMEPVGWDNPGQLGDTFGGLNALFSGMAFIALIGTLVLQRMELRLQRIELQDTRGELRRSADAQEGTAELYALAALLSAAAARMQFYGSGKTVADQALQEVRKYEEVLTDRLKKLELDRQNRRST